jgi:hypothetical protein
VVNTAKVTVCVAAAIAMIHKAGFLLPLWYQASNRTQLGMPARPKAIDR